MITKPSYLTLDIVKKLRKSPDVKRELNKDWTLDKKPGQGGSIFDDFLGGGSSSGSDSDSDDSGSSSSSEDIVIKKKEEKGIQVDDSTVLT